MVTIWVILSASHVIIIRSGEIVKLYEKFSWLRFQICIAARPIVLLIDSTIARHHEYTLKGDVIAMPGLPKHLTERALEAAAAAIATGIVSVVMKKGFSHEQGAQRRLLCEKENRLTTHVAVSFSEAEKLSREAEIYTEQSNQHNTDILSALKRANPLSRKPYMCQECGALKWV